MYCRIVVFAGLHSWCVYCKLPPSYSTLCGQFIFGVTESLKRVPSLSDSFSPPRFVFVLCFCEKEKKTNTLRLVGHQPTPPCSRSVLGKKEKLARAPAHYDVPLEGIQRNTAHHLWQQGWRSLASYLSLTGAVLNCDIPKSLFGKSPKTHHDCLTSVHYHCGTFFQCFLGFTPFGCHS